MITKKRTVPITRKLITALKNLPYVTPVSYTHLDVYKRQGANTATPNPAHDDDHDEDHHGHHHDEDHDHGFDANRVISEDEQG